MIEKKTLPVQFRAYSIERGEDAEKTRSVALSFSSEEPYDRGWGVEILDHKAEAVDLSRLNDGAPLLVNHDTDSQVGVVSKAEIADKRGRAVVRFGKSAKAEEIFRDVLDGIRQKVSVAYRVLDMALERKEGDKEFYRVTRWLPLEVSIVGIPADNTVGIGRNANLQDTNEVKVTKPYEPAKTEGTAQSNAEAASPAEAAAKAAEAGKSAPENKQPQAAPTNIQVKETPKMPENTQDLVAAEKARTAALLAIGERFDCAAEARKAIADNTSEHDFRCWVMENKFKATPTPSANIGMSDKEIKQYSFSEAIRQLAFDKKLSGLYKEASDAVEKVRGQAARGCLIPHDVMARDVTAGTTTTGGYACDSITKGPIIEALDNAILCVKAGAQTLYGLAGNSAVYIPRISAHPTCYYVAEAGAVTESQWTLGRCALTPKTLGCYVEITRQALLQSGFPLESIVRSDILNAIALAVDRAAVYGNYKGTTTLGTQPIGLLNDTTITRTALGTTCLGDIPTYSDLVGLQTTVGEANGFGPKMAYMTNHGIRGKLKTTASSTAIAGLGFVCQRVNGQDEIDGFPVYVTEQVPKTIPLPSTTLGAVDSGIIFGNFAQLLIGFWSGIDVTIDPYYKADYGLTRVVAFQDFDVTTRQPGAFVRVTDAITATT